MPNDMITALMTSKLRLQFRIDTKVGLCFNKFQQDRYNLKTGCSQTKQSTPMRSHTKQNGLFTQKLRWQTVKFGMNNEYCPVYITTNRFETKKHTHQYNKPSKKVIRQTAQNAHIERIIHLSTTLN